MPIAVLVFGSVPYGHVHLLGRLDAHTIAVLRETVTALRAEGFSVLTVDPSALTALSPCGAQALRHLREEFDAASGHLMSIAAGMIEDEVAGLPLTLRPGP